MWHHQAATLKGPPCHMWIIKHMLRHGFGITTNLDKMWLRHYNWCRICTYDDTEGVWEYFNFLWLSFTLWDYMTLQDGAVFVAWQQYGTFSQDVLGTVGVWVTEKSSVPSIHTNTQTHINTALRATKTGPVSFIPDGLEWGLLSWEVMKDTFLVFTSCHSSPLSPWTFSYSILL